MSAATTVLVALTTFNGRTNWVLDHYLVVCSCGFTHATPSFKRAQDATMHRFSHEGAPDRMPHQVNVQLRKRTIAA